MDNPHNTFFIFFSEMLMPLAAELSGKYHPIVGKRIVNAVESLIDRDANATFDKIINTDDRKIAKVIGKHIEDIRDKPLSNEEWQQLEKAIHAIKKISTKVYSNGLQAPEALYRAAKRNDFDRALVEEGILDEKDIAMIKQVFAEISGKRIEKKPPAPKFGEARKREEEELRAKGVPEEEIYRELERKGIPRELAKIILDVKAAETTPTSQIRRMIERYVGRDPQKAKALLEAMERTGKLVPVPKYWANIVSKIATGEIKEKELLEALAVSKVFHTAYSKAIAKAAERDEPENTMQRMMFIKKVLEEAHRETLEALKEHPVYGEFVRMKAPAIEREIKATAETLSKTYYAKARGDPSLSAREFLQMELNPTVETLAPLRKHLKKVNEDFLAMGRPQEETISKVYPEMVGHLTRLGMSPFAEKEYVGITHKHEQIRKRLKEIR